MDPIFASTDELYRAIQELFERIRLSVSNPIDNLTGSRLIIRIRTSEPPAEIVVNGRQNPVMVSFGPTHMHPDLDVSMPANILHQILKHELSLKEAIVTKKMKVMGPVWKTKPLASILDEGRQIYPEVLLNQGLIK